PPDTCATPAAVSCSRRAGCIRRRVPAISAPPCSQTTTGAGGAPPAGGYTSRARSQPATRLYTTLSIDSIDPRDSVCLSYPCPQLGPAAHLATERRLEIEP